MAPVALPRLNEIGIDGSVLAFTAVISVLPGFSSGCSRCSATPAGTSPARSRREDARTTSGRERHRARSALVVAQVALALVLLVGSGLMARSFRALRRVDPGFAAADRLTFRLSLPTAEYPDAAEPGRVLAAARERMAAIPGVGSVALTTAVPLEGLQEREPHGGGGPADARRDSWPSW